MKLQCEGAEIYTFPVRACAHARAFLGNKGQAQIKLRWVLILAWALIELRQFHLKFGHLRNKYLYKEFTLIIFK